MERKLKALVVSKYGTLKRFADVMNWSYRKASDLVSLRRAPSAEDMESISDACDIKTAEQFMEIFFPNLSTKWTN